VAEKMLVGEEWLLLLLLLFARKKSRCAAWRQLCPKPYIVKVKENVAA
jgi:hypothetical protein